MADSTPLHVDCVKDRNTSQRAEPSPNHLQDNVYVATTAYHAKFDCESLILYMSIYGILFNLATGYHWLGLYIEE